MNTNTVSLDIHEAGVESAETGTLLTRRLVIRILAWVMIGLMCMVPLLGLGVLLTSLVRFISHTH